MISKLIKMVVILYLFLVSIVRAEEISVNVTGRGMSYSSAVLDGLKQAVAQVSGITIDAQSLYNIEESIKDIDTAGMKDSYSKLSQSSQSEIISRINGYISGYKVLLFNKNDDGLNIIDLEVNIEKYKSPGVNSNRYKLAVVGITSDGGKCFNDSLSAESIKKEATKELVSAFTSLRKFSVLDRDEQNAYDIEKALIINKETATKELSRLGLVESADYILTGKIKNINIWQNTQTVDLTGEKIYTRTAKATFEYKLLIFATREVKVSSTVSVSLYSNEINGKSCSDILAMLMKKIANKVSKACVENIYPPRIVNVKDNNIYINI